MKFRVLGISAFILAFLGFAFAHGQSPSDNLFKPFTYEDITRVLKKDFRDIPLSKSVWEKMMDFKARVVIPHCKRHQYSEPVIAALRTVPRELYAYNYEQKKYFPERIYPIQSVIGIGWGSTISPIDTMAFFTHIVKPRPNHTALEIGTGSGYQAALLSRIVKKVYTVEIRQELAKNVMRAMKTIGYQNIEYKIGDGYYGWKEKAPFDCILVTCQANHIPPPLIAQLKPGGRMIIPVGPAWKKQTVYLVSKTESGHVRTIALGPVFFIPMLAQYSKGTQVLRTKKEGGD